MKVNIYIDKKKINKKGKAPLKISIHLGGNQFWLPAFESVNPRFFKNGRVLSGEEFSTEINKSLRFRVRTIEDIVREAEEIGTLITQKYLHNEFQKIINRHIKSNDNISNNQTELVDFWDYWEDYLLRGNAKFSKEHLRKYNQVKTHLKNFNYQIDFETFNEIFEEEYFRGYLVEEIGLSNNTICKHVKCIRSVLSYAEKLGCKKVLPAYKYYKDNYINPKRLHLTWDEVEKIMAFEPFQDLDRKVKDLFLISCLTGLRWQDINQLTELNFQEQEGRIYIHVHSLKSKKNISYPLNGRVLKIFKKYNFNLPKVSNQKCNEALKRNIKYIGSRQVVEKKEKWRFISMHIGRHTFACEFLKRNSDKGLHALKSLSELLGHSTTRTTEIYWNMILADKDEMLLNSFMYFHL